MAIASRTATYDSDYQVDNSITVAEPTGAAENDILFLFVQWNDDARYLSVEPTGWTALNTWSYDGSGYPGYKLYWRRRGSSALTSGERTVTMDGSGWIEGEISAFSGCITSGNPWDAIQYGPRESVAAPNPPSATSSGAGRMAVAFGGTWSGYTTGGGAPPTGYTMTRTVASGEGVSSAYKAVGSGAEDPGVFGNVTGTDYCGAATVILTPAGGTQSNAPRVVHLQNMMRG